MGSKKDLTNLKFGRLTVISEDGHKLIGKVNKIMWLCKCECGEHKRVSGDDLKSLRVKSCGCLQLELKFKHGLHKHPLYNRWKSMIDRCNNKKSKDYENYGGRGITVCKRWSNKNGLKNYVYDLEDSYFMAVIDVGEKCQLDRIDNNSSYKFENVRWVTQIDNARNRRTNKEFIVTYPDGKEEIKKCISKFAKEMNLNKSSIAHCLSKKHKQEIHLGYKFKYTE